MDSLVNFLHSSTLSEYNTFDNSGDGYGYPGYFGHHGAVIAGPASHGTVVAGPHSGSAAVAGPHAGSVVIAGPSGKITAHGAGYGGIHAGYGHHY